jgi:hypothetical protein
VNQSGHRGDTGSDKANSKVNSQVNVEVNVKEHGNRSNGQQLACPESHWLLEAVPISISGSRRVSTNKINETR